MNKHNSPSENLFLKAFLKLINEKVPTVNQTYPASFDSGRTDGQTTFPPRPRVGSDCDRSFRHNGVDGWRFQGHDANGNVLLTTDVYKQVELRDLKALNVELSGDVKPIIGKPYLVRRTNGTLESFVFQGVNPASKKLMMVKPEGCVIAVTEQELNRENFHPHRLSIVGITSKGKPLAEATFRR